MPSANSCLATLSAAIVTTEKAVQFGRWSKNGMKLAASFLVALACAPAQGRASPILGSELASFTILGASAVTNTGPTVVTGNLGVSNNASVTGITGFLGTLANDGPGTATGTAHQGDAFATTADIQLTAAMTSLGLLGPGTLLGADLNGLILAPGIYSVLAGVSNLTGTLSLNGGGSTNALWVFQMASTLITSSGSIVSLTNIGPGSEVYWNVGSSATLDTTTSFVGNILASASISLNNGVTLSCGRALAHTGAVTLINDTVDATGCAGSIPVVAVPEPGTLGLLGMALLGLVVLGRRKIDQTSKGTIFNLTTI